MYNVDCCTLRIAETHNIIVRQAVRRSLCVCTVAAALNHHTEITRTCLLAANTHNGKKVKLRTSKLTHVC